MNEIRWHLIARRRAMLVLLVLLLRVAQERRESRALEPEHVGTQRGCLEQ